MILVAVAGFFVERIGHVLQKTAVIQVALGMIEVPPQEITGESLDQHIKAKIPTIHPDARVGDAWRWNARRVEQSAANIFRAEAGILNGIIEMNLLQTVKTLARDKLAETQRQCRLVIN